MAKFKKILVPYDGSPHSKTALEWALLLAGMADAELHVIKVFEPLGQNGGVKFDYAFREQLAEHYAEIEQEDLKMLEAVKSYCQQRGCHRVQIKALKGHVASMILDYAGQNGMDLLVSGTKGYGVLREMLVGSVTSSVVSLSQIPVLVVKAHTAPGKLKKMLVAYDDSPFAKAALDTATDLALAAAAKISVVKVNDPRDFLLLSSWSEAGSAMKLKAKLDELDAADQKLLDGAKAIAAKKGMSVATELLDGLNVADVILRRAEETDADIVVAGTLGHGVLGGLLVGSVTRNLVSLSKIPVLVVKK